MSPFSSNRTWRLAFAAIAAAFPFFASPAAGQHLSAGRDFTIAVDGSAGALWAWGGNARGQLGTGSGENSLVPARISAESWKAAAAGGAHTVAIRADGSLWSWGENSDGQLGRNDFTPDPLPGRVGSATDWIAVAAGGVHTLALRENGDLHAWGDNFFGQLGNGSTADRSTPVKIEGGPFVKIAAGETHSLAIDADGKLWAWGQNLSGQLGIGSISSELRRPVQVGNASDWLAIAAGLEHSLGLRRNGELYSWGRNLEGQLGNGSWGGAQPAPARIGNRSDWSAVAAGDLHSLAVRADGTLWSWGQNFAGQLGHGVAGNELRPRQIGLEADWTDVAGGGSHTVARRSSGAIWSSGDGSQGQLGNNEVVGESVLSPSFFGLPDLVVDLLVPDGIALGEKIAVNVFVRNRGTGSVAGGGDFAVEIAMSRAAEWSGDTSVIDTFTVGDAFAPGESRSFVREIELPANAVFGDYYFGARVDARDAVRETEEENNVSWNGEPVSFLPDLTFAAIVLEPTELERGSSWPFALKIRNEGVGDIPAGLPIRLDARISTVPVWGAQESIALIDEALYMDGLAAGEEAEISFDSVVIPEHAPSGNYYLGAQLDGDNRFAESDESNNARWSAAANLSVTGLEIGAGLGESEIGWTTGGSAHWFAQTEERFEEGPAVQTPPLTEGQQAWLQGRVDGPVLIRFHWKSESQSRENHVVFSIDGAERARISGKSGWQEVTILASGYANQLRWTYVKNDFTGSDDRAWVSQVTFEEVRKPDLVVTEIDYEMGEFVLQRDPITIRAYGKNQGVPAAIPDDFRMEVRLSRNLQWGDEDDVSLGFLNKLQGLDADNRFVYQATLELPDSIPSGDFYIGVFADSTDVIDEFDETNNIGWSEEAGVTVVQRPDLRVANLTYEPGISTIRPDADGERDELSLRFDLVNAGLADVPAEPFTVRVVLSPDRNLDSGNESVLVELDVSDGLHAGQSRPYNVTTMFPVDTLTGVYQYVGVLVDAYGEIAESREDNNSALTDSRNVFVQEMPLGVALDRTDLDWLTGDSLANPAWYGQSEVAFSQNDPVGAARPAKNIPVGSQANLQTTVSVQGPSPISFFWKVDSAQHFGNDGSLVASNSLSFSINDVEMARISGNADWQPATFHLPEAGTYTLRWSYTKEIPAAGDADAGWVDRVTYTAPDLVVTDVSYEPGIYEPGDVFDYVVTIANHGGLAVPATPSYSVQVRLAPNRDSVRNLDWSGSNATDVLLETFELAAWEERALAVGQTLRVERSVVVPDGLISSGDFYLGVWVDPAGRIAESNANNNLWWPDASDVTLLAPLNLADALGLELTHPDGWRIGGHGAWTGQTGEFDSAVAGNESAAQSPILGNNQQAWFETEIEGPAIMNFSWKVSSRRNFNFLRLYVSGKRETQISGDVDWTEGGPVFIPAGPQMIRFSYEKTSGAGDDLDTGWVDEIRLTEVAQPDLVITSVDYQPGPYVLERDRLTLTIVAENRGAAFPEDVQWEVSDLEVRLSSNRVVGDEDDIVLGNFARVETFDSGARLVFSGDLHLPLFPELPDEKLFQGNHYLIARVDPFERVDEFDGENNTWVSAENDVAIRRLPHLISDQFAFDFEKVYFPYAPLEIDWELRNRGLGDVSGSIPYKQVIGLMAVDRAEPDFGNAIHVADLSVFVEDAYLPGVNGTHRNGSGLPIHSRLTLPSPAKLLAGLGEVDPGLEEGAGAVLANLYKIETDYLYYISITTDADSAIEQSSDLRRTEYVGQLFAILAPHNQPETFAQWLALYPGLELDDPEAAPAGDGIPNLLKYAFNLNPLVPQAGGAAIYNAHGIGTYGGEDYLRITFNILPLATDLRYIVEVSSNLVEWTPALVLEPPYENLTGFDGLLSHPLVVAASNQGVTAAVTVRDEIAIADAQARFIRVRVEHRE